MIAEMQELHFDFEGIPDLDLGFDAALEEAVSKELIEEATAILMPHFERAREAGDFDQIARMSMELGALACMHDHLQPVSNSLTESFMGKDSEEDHTGHDHDAETNDDRHNTKDCKQCRAGKFCPKV